GSLGTIRSGSPPFAVSPICFLLTPEFLLLAPSSTPFNQGRSSRSSLSFLQLHFSIHPMNKLNAAIFGATGYTGEELVRRLAKHPLVEIVALTSRQAAGKPAFEIFPWLDRRSNLG